MKKEKGNILILLIGFSGLCGFLSVIFVALKLLNAINWDSWWIICPIWLGSLISLTILFGALIKYFICDYFQQKREINKDKK